MEKRSRPDQASLMVQRHYHHPKESKSKKYNHQAMMMRPRDADIVSLAKTSISFSMVRHPFERIISAYEDKVVF